MTEPLTYPQAVDKARSEARPHELLRNVMRADGMWYASYWSVSSLARLMDDPDAKPAISRKDVPIGPVVTPSQ